MATKTVAAEAVLETEKKADGKGRKTVTNWKVFTEMGLIPARWRCDGYKGSHPSDLSCHTTIPPTLENIQRHSDPQHGGGWFRVRFRTSDGKTSPLWEQLEEAGIELKEFYCPHCRADVPVSPRRIVYHLNTHPGANRVNLDPQVLCMWLGTEAPEADELEGLYE